MIYEILSRSDLSPRLPESTSAVTLTSYARTRAGFLADDGHRWGVLICPGGGYEVVADSEGEPVALDFLSAGIQAFVLRYSTAPARYPQQLLEAAAAMSWIKSHAEEFGIDRFAVCGFSAGGHLAGCLSNLWAEPLLRETLGLPAEQFRPDAAILCYPVITMASASPGAATFPNLLGPDYQAEQYAPLSLETSVSDRTPPAFLWCTCADGTVDMENTLSYAAALRGAGIPFSLHVYPRGPHAMALATAESAWSPRYTNAHAATWMPLCIQWLKEELG